MLRLVVFDLDGTLVDSHRDLSDATNALLEELGAAALPAPAITAMVGEGAAVLVRRALTRAGLDPDTPGALDRFLAHYDTRLLATTRPYPGMVESLEGLRSQGRSLAVLTNKPQRASERVLDGLGLRQLFDAVIGGDTTHGRKPNPAGLRALLAAADARPDEAILVGDSPVDLATARAALTRVCLARYGFGYRFADVDFDGTELFIERPSDLIAALDAVDART
jgi:phosphoglycolate phosphatase